MSDLDVQTAARFFATHALVLLALALVAASAALAVVFGVVRLAARHRGWALGAMARLVTWAEEVPALGRLIRQTRGFIPNAYVAMHLAAGLAVAAAVGGFAAVADQTIGEDAGLAAFDVAFAQALHTQTSDTGLALFTAVSLLGSRVALTALTLIVAAVLLAQRRHVLAAGWLGAQVGGAVLNLVLKAGFARARPEFADPALAASSWSFPSGHAMGTFIAFGVGGYLILRRRRSWTAAVAVSAVVLAWCLLMAFSRLYLGVHYVSDVLAGLVAGVAWVAVCVSAMEVVQRRGPRDAG